MSSPPGSARRVSWGKTRDVLPLPAASTVERYVATVDRLLPHRVVGFYVVGSIALGGYRPLRSDIDFVAVVDRGFSAAELRRLRLAQLATGARTSAAALARGQRALPGTCNGVYVSEDELGLPVSRIRPVASHTGPDFNVGRAFDVNPVVWKTLAERGIAVRGAGVDDLPLDTEPASLRPWTKENLNTYWRRFAASTLRSRPPMSRLLPRRWVTAWGVLGVSRLHATIATGDVISKEAAGEYAKDVFDRRWHPLIHEALAYWREEQPLPEFEDRSRRDEAMGEFMLHVIDHANLLTTT